MKLASIAEDYIERYRAPAQRELSYYARQRSVTDAIDRAALSSLPNGKRHPHQRRIPGRVLNAARNALLRRAHILNNASSFAELHSQVANTIGAIHGIGALATYDISQRIGAYLKLEPKMVYLHAGTREGARALGIRGDIVERNQLPFALRRLSPAELEDCLCIYKRALRGRRWSRSSCVSQRYCA